MSRRTAAPLVTLLTLLGLPCVASGYELGEIPVTEWPSELGPDPMTPARYHERVPVSGPLEIGYLDRRYPVATSRAQAERGRVLLLVESGLTHDLAESLDRFVEDLTLDGHSVLVEEASGGTGEELKAHLGELFAEDEGLEGAILVGELPMLWFEFLNDYGAYGYAVFPSDLAMADLDGSWEDFDGNGVYDAHSASGGADTAPEFWIGRMNVTSRMGDEVELLEAYFERNHAYRRGEILPNGSSLVYVDDDWEWWAGEYAHEIELGFRDITAESEIDTTRKDDYLPRLEQDFDNIAVFVHSSPEEHYFVYRGNYDTMYWSEVPEASTALFYDLFACSNANIAEPVNMAAVYALGTEFGLLSLGSTKTGSMLERSYYYGRLGDFEEFGAALLGWWEDVQPYDEQQRNNWYYGMVHIGDPTLRVGYPTVELGVDSILIDEPAAELIEVEIDLGNSGLDGYYWSLDLEEGSLDEQPWIQPSKTEGSVLGSDDSLVLTLDPALAGGADPAQTLLVRAPGATNNPVSLPIEIVQWGSAELCVSPGTVELELTSTLDPGDASLEVGNCNPGVLAWSASSDVDWLELGSVESDGMDGTEILELFVDAGELDPGKDYTATLDFEAPDAVNSPVRVEVQLRFAEGVRPGRCGCSSRAAPGRLAWLPALLVGLFGLRRRRLG